MSFKNPFKTHPPKKSAISKTEEREFEREVKRIEVLDSNIHTLARDVKNSNDALLGVSKMHSKMTDDLNRSAQQIGDAELIATAETWHHTAQTMDNLALELSSNCNRTVTDPMKRLSCLMPPLQAAIKRRDQYLTEYSKYQGKVGKYLDRERTGVNVAKLDQHKKSRGSAKDSYEHQHAVLMEDIPKLYDGRIQYFQPCFEALIRSQVKYYQDTHNAVDALLNTTGGKDIDPDELTQRINQNLHQIKALSTTVDD